MIKGSPNLRIREPSESKIRKIRRILGANEIQILKMSKGLTRGIQFRVYNEYSST